MAFASYQWQFLNKAAPNVWGDSSSGSSDSSYRQRKPPDPWPGRVSGWARKQGYDPESLWRYAWANPSFVYPDALKGLNQGSPLADTLNELPVGDLAMILYGSRGRKNLGPWADPAAARWQQKHTNEYGYPDPLPDRLKPDAGAYANAVAKLAQQAGAGGMTLDPGDFLQSLTGANRQSSLGQLFRKGDPATALSYYRTYLGAISQLMPQDQAAGFQAYANQLVNQWGNRAMRHRNAPPINRWVGSRLGEYV